MTDTLFASTDRGATISPDGLYRYDLWRRWDDGPMLGFVMLNPSTGDADLDDATLRRCMGFARREGFAGIVVRNLFAYRTPKPSVLAAAARSGTDVVGPDNDMWLGQLASPTRQFSIPKVVLAWGTVRKVHGARPMEVLRIFAEAGEALDRRVVHFVDPRHPDLAAPHPLRLPTDCPLEAFA